MENKGKFNFCAIPATLLTDATKKYGFWSLPEHIRSWLTLPGYQTSANKYYVNWSCNTMVNLAANKHDSRMVASKGSTASNDDSSGLNLRGGDNSWPLLDSIDSK